ncbi:MAG TPA: hypothetical protein VIM69_03250 [Opitutaceae bacterium]
MLKAYSIAALAVLVSSLYFVARSNAAPATQGLTVALEEQSEVAHVERLFSGAHWTHPAPTTWSSRLDVRWNARWETAPQYAV